MQIFGRTYRGILSKSYYYCLQSRFGSEYLEEYHSVLQANTQFTEYTININKLLFIIITNILISSLLLLCHLKTNFIVT